MRAAYNIQILSICLFIYKYLSTTFWCHHLVNLVVRVIYRLFVAPPQHAVFAVVWKWIIFINYTWAPPPLAVVKRNLSVRIYGKYPGDRPWKYMQSQRAYQINVYTNVLILYLDGVYFKNKYKIFYMSSPSNKFIFIRLLFLSSYKYKWECNKFPKLLTTTKIIKSGSRALPHTQKKTIKFSDLFICI